MNKYTFECNKGHNFSLEVDGLLDTMPPSCLICFGNPLKQTEGPKINV